MRKIITYCFLLLCMPAHPARAAVPVDTLGEALRKMHPDTNKVQACFNLIKKLQYSDPVAAIKLSDTALALAQKLNYPRGIAFSNHYLGYLYMGQKLFPRALDHLLRADQYYRSVSDRKRSGGILNNIAGIYYELKDYDKAFDYYSRALEDYKSANFTSGVATILNNIGSLRAEKNDYSQALYYLGQALELRTKLSDSAGMVSTLSSIGLCDEKLKNYPAALDCYRRGIAICKASNDRYHLSTLMNYLGELYSVQAKRDSAIYCYRQGLELAEKVSEPSFQEGALHALSQLYDSLGDVDKAYMYYKKYITLHDSIYNQEDAQKFLQAEMNFRFEQEREAEKTEQVKKEELALQQRQREAIVRNGFIAGLLLTLVLALYMYRGYRHKLRDNMVLTVQRNEIAQQKKEIQDSIDYAKYIQDALLPSRESIRSFFPESFIFFRPKEMVSGDFYWMHRSVNQGREKIYVAAADCTGHGVPGAFMSMIGCDKLNAIAGNRTDLSAGAILKELNDRMIRTLKKERSAYTSLDGMDIALCCFDLSGLRLAYAGAKSPAWILRDSKVMTLSPGTFSIAGHTPPGTAFVEHDVPVQRGDCIYLFSNGFINQHAGSEGSYGEARLKSFLLRICTQPMDEQENLLAEEFEKWKGMQAQTDDVLLIGIRIT